MSDEKDANQEPSAAAGRALQPVDPILPGPLPPEMEALGEDEVRAVFEEILLVGLRWTKSPERARGLLSELYVKLTTTQRWDPTKAPLRVFAMGALRNLLRHQPTTDRVPALERRAMEGFHREIRPERVDSTEEMHLERAYYEARRAKYARRLALLEARVAGMELPPRIIEAYREREFKTRQAVADHLGVPVKDVYRAIETMRYHLNKIVAEETAEEGEKKKP